MNGLMLMDQISEEQAFTDIIRWYEDIWSLDPFKICTNPTLSQIIR